MPRERIADSFLNIVPELLQDRAELQNCMSVAKLRSFHKEINDNHDNNLSWSRNEQRKKITYIHDIFYFLQSIFSGQNGKKEKNSLTRDSKLTWARAWLVQRYNSSLKTKVNGL